MKRIKVEIGKPPALAVLPCRRRRRLQRPIGRDEARGQLEEARQIRKVADSTFVIVHFKLFIPVFLTLQVRTSNNKAHD